MEATLLANMNHLAHPVIALVLQAIIGLTSGDWWTGAAAGSFYFVGREYAQAEYRNIEHNYGGFRRNMPFWGGCEPRAWTRKGLLDFILPSIAVIVVALACNYL
jgi:hypothetical protein